MSPAADMHGGGLLHGRRALLVGAGPGLGAAIAEQLSAAGARLMLVARSEATLGKTAASIAAAPDHVATLAADLGSSDDRDRITKAVAAELGGIDIVVFNAARHGVQAPFAEGDVQDWRLTMDANLFAPLCLMQLLLPALRQSPAASVVFIGAMAMRMVSSIGRAGYALSKAAINQAVRSLAYELGPEAIRVNAVVPGWMDSAHVQSWRADPKLAPLVERARQAIPLGRIPLPAEVAGSVVYLASSLSVAVTGVCLDVNGGHFMGA